MFDAAICIPVFLDCFYLASNGLKAFKITNYFLMNFLLLFLQLHAVSSLTVIN